MLMEFVMLVYNSSNTITVKKNFLSSSPLISRAAFSLFWFESRRHCGGGGGRGSKRGRTGE